MSSRNEELIQAMINGDDVSFTPESRMEQFLYNCITGRGSEGLPQPTSRMEALCYQLAEVMAGGGAATVDDTQTYMLLTEDGTEIPAVMVGEETVFTATENDIRAGTVAATDSGVTTGTKEIPAYYVHEGVKIVTPGSTFVISDNDYDYTKLQALFCLFNSNSSNSVATEKVAINTDVYAVQSTDSISVIQKNDANKTIEFGVSNETTSPKILRFMFYKEEF